MTELLIMISVVLVYCVIGVIVYSIHDELRPYHSDSGVIGTLWILSLPQILISYITRKIVRKIRK